MKEWYKQGLEDRSFLKQKRGNWASLYIVIVLFVAVSLVSLAVVYWVVEGKQNPLSEVGETIEDPAALEIIAPREVSSGDTVTIIFTYKNTGTARLIDIHLQVAYPDNFVFTGSVRQEPQNFDKNYWNLPALEPNSSRKLEVTGQLFGKANEQKDLKAVLTYKPTNFHASFKKEAQTTMLITASLLDIALQIPENILKKQTITYGVVVTNAAAMPLDNVEVRVLYPSELIVDSLPEELVDGVWYVGNLEPNEKKFLKLDGTIKARVGELKEFSAKAGLKTDGIFVLQNQVVRVVGVIDPSADIRIEKKNIEPLSFGGIMDVNILVSNISTLVLEEGVLEIIVTDDEEIILWDTVITDNKFNFEVIKTGEDIGHNQKKIRFFDLPFLEPAAELNIFMQLPIIEVPYNIGAENFVVTMEPSLRATSSDISVPVEILGEKATFVVR